MNIDPLAIILAILIGLLAPTSSLLNIPPPDPNPGTRITEAQPPEEILARLVTEDHVIELNPKVIPEAPQRHSNDPCRLVEGHDWDRRTAYAVCIGESRGNPQVINPRDYHAWGSGPCRGSIGLFQIGCAYVGHLDDIDREDDLLDPETNVRAAYQVYQRYDNTFNAWSAYNRKTSGYQEGLDGY